MVAASHMQDPTIPQMFMKTKKSMARYTETVAHILEDQCSPC